MANIIKRIDDYVNQLHEKYPEMSKKDILKILKMGFNFYRKLITIGCGVNIGSNEMATRTQKVGVKDKLAYKDNLAARKARVKWNRSDKEFDGYYYFALGKNQFAELDQEKLKKKCKLKFKHIWLFKSAEECWLRHSYKDHFFKLRYPVDCGFFMYKDEFVTNDYEYLGHEREKSSNKWIQQRPKHGFKPDFTAKQLLKWLS